jgi:hypothetical protein
MSKTVHSVKLQAYDAVDLDRVSYSNGDLVFDITNQTLRIMDGATAGGRKIATQPWVTTALGSYVTNTSLTTTLASYETTANLATTLSSYVTSSSLATTLSSYDTISARNTALSSYVTTSSLNTTLSSYALTSALPTVPTYSVTTNAAIGGGQLSLTGTTFTFNPAVQYSLPIAVAGTSITGTLGGVIPDGTTITIDSGSGVISSVSYLPANAAGVLTNNGTGVLSWAASSGLPGGTDGSGSAWGGFSTSATTGGVTFGSSSSSSNQSIVIGVGSNNGTATDAVVIGQFAGQQAGTGSVNLGYYSGGTYGTQGDKAISIGYNTGVANQGTNSIAIGTLAGFGNDTGGSYGLVDINNPSIDDRGNISTGVYLWKLNVGSKVIITGTQAGTGSITGYTSGSTYYVIAWNNGTIQLSSSPGGSAISSTAGSLYGLTITGAGNAQADNTIILNATGSIVEGVANQTNSFYVAPVRGVTSTGSWSNPTHQLPSGFYMVAYNPTTKEFIYWS